MDISTLVASRPTLIQTSSSDGDTRVFVPDCRLLRQTVTRGRYAAAYCLVAQLALLSCVAVNLSSPLGICAGIVFLLQMPVLCLAYVIGVRGAIAAMLRTIEYRITADSVRINVLTNDRILCLPRGRVPGWRWLRRWFGTSSLAWDRVVGMSHQRITPFMVVYGSGQSPVRLWLSGLSKDEILSLRDTICERTDIDPAAASGPGACLLGVTTVPRGVKQTWLQRFLAPPGAGCRSMTGGTLSPSIHAAAHGEDNAMLHVRETED